MSVHPITVIENGRAIDPSLRLDGLFDLWIENGRIKRVAPKGTLNPPEGSERINAEGCWVVPGLVDLHVHLREPGQEYKEDIASGLAAAAAGGFTTVCAMANTQPINDSRAVTEAILEKAKHAHGARLRVFGAMTKGLEGNSLTEMADLKEAGAIGVSDDGRCVMRADVMRRAMEYAGNYDLLVSQHCEDHDLTRGAQMHEGKVSARLGLAGWPREAEDIIVARDLILAERTGARYHVAHLSTKGSVRLVREAKARGLRVSAEVTPHHLSLTDEDVLGYNTYCKVNPPLRTDEDREAVREGLRDGTIDCIATDHAPHSTVEKDCEFGAAAVGINGLETAVSALLSLVREDALSPARLIEALSTAPSKLIGEEPTRIASGSRADLTVIDPAHRWTPTALTLVSKSHNTPLLGRECTGQVRHTWVGGVHVFSRAAMGEAPGLAPLVGSRSASDEGADK